MTQREYLMTHIETSFEDCISELGCKNGLILITEALERAGIRVKSEAGESYLSLDSSVDSFVKSDQALAKCRKPISIDYYLRDDDQ